VRIVLDKQKARRTAPGSYSDRELLQRAGVTAVRSLVRFEEQDTNRFVALLKRHRPGLVTDCRATQAPEPVWTSD
jgi:hypothetical protein